MEKLRKLSLFLDFLHERNKLMEEVFPELQEYCHSLGLEFQVVDMRWGVKDHRVLSHQISKICVDEISICNNVSISPSFIVSTITDRRVHIVGLLYTDSSYT